MIIQLSTGYKVEIIGKDMEEDIKDFKHLLNAIVMESISEVQKENTSENFLAAAMARIDKEISYIAEHCISDREEFIKRILMVDCINHFGDIISMVNQKSPNRSYGKTRRMSPRRKR